jgi:hypothetical protein
MFVMTVKDRDPMYCFSVPERDEATRVLANMFECCYFAPF